MPRDEGFAVADTDTGKLDDPKYKRLWRDLRDPDAMNRCAVLHEAVTLKSWANGERVTAEDAAPFWMPDVKASIAALQSVGLLDKSGRIPIKSWKSWFGAAYARRQVYRDNGAKGGRPPQNKHEIGKPTGYQAVSKAEPTPNPVRTVPSVPSEPFLPNRPRRSILSDNAPAGAREEPGLTTQTTNEENLPPHLRVVQVRPD